MEHTTAIQHDLFAHRAPDRSPIPTRRQPPDRVPDAEFVGGEPVKPPCDFLQREGLAEPGRSWRRTHVHPDTFCVSELGEVLRIERVAASGRRYGWKRMTPCVNSPGYPGVSLTRDGVAAYRHVHVLVAVAHLPKPDGPLGRGRGKLQVHHINGDRRDPRAVNLQFLLGRENNAEAHALLSEADVLEARRRYAEEDVTHEELAAEFGVARPTMTHALSGGSWSHLPLE